MTTVVTMMHAVVFDADDTLIDLQPAINLALDHVVAQVCARDPSSRLVKEDLQRGWHEVFAEDPSAPVARIREESLRRELRRHGDEELVERVFAEFYRVRYANSRPYEDALPMLATLRSDYLLGYATNGNSIADRCGLGGEFAFELYAHQGGLPKKPAAEFFHAVAAHAGTEAKAIAYVGDNFEHDVVAAAAVGMRTVWVNRAGHPLPAGTPVRPDAVIGRLAELPAALCRIASDHGADHV
jgi:FMN hydrolase / 5-amino-6-(5-phospho-D-ribitylamino)uracil phosphatase